MRKIRRIKYQLDRGVKVYQTEKETESKPGGESNSGAI